MRKKFTTLTLSWGCILLLLLGYKNVSAQSPQPGFASVTVSNQWNEVVGLTFTNDGINMFVWERGGKVWTVTNGVKRLVLDISEEVGAWHDFGLLGFSLHPQFEQNGYIYLLYLVDRHHLINYGTAAYSPTVNDYFSATISRLTRYTLTKSGAIYSVSPGSRKILIGETKSTGIVSLERSHGPGSLVFGTDQTLLISAGDGAHGAGTDAGSGSGTYFAQALADGTLTDALNVGAFRSQILDCPNGKILRIDPETGEGIPSNPFYDPTRPNSNISKVWALGLRNPFRMSLKPGSGSHNPHDGNPGILYVGDVGYYSWEELNVVDKPGMNFGWPIFEGLQNSTTYATINTANKFAPNPVYQVNGCTQQYFYFQNLIKQATPNGAAVFTNPCSTEDIPTTIPTFVHSRPIIDWFHSASGPSRTGTFSGQTATVANIGGAGSPVSGTQFGGSAAIAGVYYTGSDFPENYRNKLFFGDYSGAWIRSISLNDQEQPVQVAPFINSGSVVVGMATHPTQEGLYYVNFPSEIRRVSYSSNRPPIAVASADLVSGASPLSIQFDGDNSTDPENLPLSFEWNFGDGSPISNIPNPNHTFTTPGTTPIQFTVSLKVTDDQGLQHQTMLVISVNNTAPVVTITSPLDGTLYPLTGETVYPLRATVTDLEHSVDELTYKWQTTLHHENHSHPEPIDTSPETTTNISPLGCGDETYFFTISLTVTDAAGLSTTKTVTISPDCSSIVKITPLITWPDPAAIIVGTPLSATQLNAEASHNGFAIPGTFTYTPAAETILPIGNSQELAVTFMPTSTALYNSASKIVTIHVNAVPKITPLVNWANPSAIAVGTPLGSTQLNATATHNGSPVPGTFVYTPDAGTILNVGAEQDLSVTFTPTNTTVYNPVNKTVKIDVNKTFPLITWANPAPIGIGTALGAVQLNAVASYNGSPVPGTFAYTPPAGTLLSLGTGQQLSVSFTPNDADVYLPATKTVAIDVIESPPTTFYRALNLNGAALTIDGNSWQSSIGAANFSFTQVGGGVFGVQNIALIPATDANRSTMIRSSIWGNTVNINVTAVPNGSYDVYVYVWEDNLTQTYSISLESTIVLPVHNSGTGGTWSKLGPFRANITDGAINVSTNGQHANVSGIEIWTAGPPPPNQPPVVANAIADQNATAGLPINYAFPANTFSDPNAGTTLTYTATLEGGGALPGWLTFTGSTRTFSGTPLLANLGTINISVTASDGSPGGTVSDVFALTVSEAVKVTPVITWANPAPIGVGTALGTTQLNATASFNGSAVAGSFVYTPPSGTVLILGTGQQLSVSFTPTNTILYNSATKTVTIDVIESLPTTFYRALNLNGAALTIDGNSWQSSIGAANFSFTQVGGGVFGVQNIALIPATDANRSTMIRSSIWGNTVNINVTAVPNGSYDVYVYVWEDNLTQTYSISLESTIVLPVHNSGTGGTWSKLGPFRANITDGAINVSTNGQHANVSGIEIWTAGPPPPNQPPVVANAITDQNATAGLPINYAFPANTFSDPNAGTTLTYTATLEGGGALPGWLTFTGSTRTFSGTPLLANLGTINISVTASDGSPGGTVSDVFALTVSEAVKVTPVITWANPAPIGVGTALGTTQLNATASFNGSAVAGSFVYTPPSGTVLSLGTGQQLSVSFTPTNTILYNSATKTVTIDVIESLPTTFYRALNLNGAALTIDGNSWQSSIGAANFSFTQVGGGVFGVQNIALIPATDANRSTMIRSSIWGNTVNINVTAVPNGSYDVYVYVWEDNFTQTYSISLEGTVVLPVHISGPGGTWNKLGPFRANIVDGAINVSTNGQHSNVSGIEIWTAGPPPPNQPPVVANPIADQNATAGLPVSYAFPANTFSDPNAGTTLTYTATLDGGGALPGWLTFTGSTRTFSGTPLLANLGTINISVTASDGSAGGTVSDVFALTVSEAVKVTPVITWANPAPIGVGTALGTTQLNAVASYNGSAVAGSFVYTPPSGTVLILGTGQQLSVSFTPTNTILYNSATKTVTIDVIESLPTTFYRALNLNGAALTIDGNSWQSSIGAANFSFTQVGGGAFSAQSIPLIPTTDTNRATMIRSSIWGNAVNINVTSVPSGSYDVYVYVWEDNFTEAYSISLEGTVVLPVYNSGTGGTWSKLGPFRANIADGAINVSANGGHACVSGIEIWAASATPGNTPPVVSNPIADQTATVGQAFNYIVPANTFTDPDAGTVLTYSATLSNGNALPSWLSFNTTTRAFTGTPAIGDVAVLDVRVTASDGIGTGNDIFTLAVSQQAFTTFYRALNLNGAALTIDGNSWQSSIGAANFSFTQVGGGAFSAQSIPLIPTTDTNRATMIRSSIWGNGVSINVTSVPSGSYDVYVYVWEDNFTQAYSISLEGTVVLPVYNSGTGGTWSKLGPFRANITDGAINVSANGGHACLSGIEVWTGSTVSAASTSATARVATVEEQATSNSTALEANPNPFSKKLNVSFTARQSGNARVELFDIRGRSIQLIYDATMSAGETKEKELDTSTMPDGIYILQFVNGRRILRLKLMGLQ